jgi:hypothetical protein
MKTTHRFSLIAALALATTLSGFAAESASSSFRGIVIPRASTLFAVLDLDRDGIISSQEIGFAAVSLIALDLDGDSFVTTNELATPGRRGASRRNALAQPVAYRPTADLNLFVLLDANHDGILQAFELSNAPASLRQLDRNGDGALTPDEIVTTFHA